MRQFQAAQAKTVNVRQSSSPVTSSTTSPVRQTTGNRSLLALLHSGIIRAKLAVNQSGERYEREADQAAEQATRHSGSGRGERKTLAGAGHVSSVSLPGLGAGRPLSRAVRGRFEAAFGYDLSGVRIHTGPAAADAANEIGAKAFTAGRNIVFGSRVGNPESGDHSLLLAHELAHVVQQGKGAVSSIATSPAASLSAAPHGPAQANPLVTAVVAPAELGVGRSITATANVAPGAGNLAWTPVGALPAGVTVAGSGRRATIRSAAAPNPHPAAGANFTIRAARTAPGAGGDSADAVIMLVGIANVTMTPIPPFLPQVIAGGVAAPPPPPVAPALGGVADPNRGGLAGNTVIVAVVTAPAGRANTVTMPRPLSSAVAGNIITPGNLTGNATVRATDNATRSSLDVPLVIQPVPLFLAGFGALGAAGAGTYGAAYPLNFRSSDATGVLDRPVGETITLGGGDDFGIAINPPTGPNPAPIGALAAQANAWTDQLFRNFRTTATGAIAPAGVASDDTCAINVNRFVGPGVAVSLPAVQSLRQGFHFQGWGGLWGDEFDNGLHVRSLRGRPGAFIFQTEFPFSRARGPVQRDPYAGPPLIVLSAITLNSAAAPSVPLATGGLAADGVAVGGVTVNVAGTSTAAAGATVVGRAVNWSVISGPIAFVGGGAGAAVGAGNTAPATVQAGLVAGNFSVRAVDTVFPNRRVDGRVRLVPVVLRGITAPVRTVPAGTLVAAVNVVADPGGRNVNWTVDPAAAAAGVTVAPVAVAGPAAAAPARAANVTRPAAFTGRVTVTAADAIRPAARASIVITFR